MVKIKKFDKFRDNKTGEILTAMNDVDGSGILYYRDYNGEQGMFWGFTEERVTLLKNEPETRMVGFNIPNTLCVHHSEPLGCKRDDKPHTCCIEECRETDILFGTNPNRHMKVTKKVDK